MYVWLVRLRGGVRVVKIDRSLGEGDAVEVLEGPVAATHTGRSPRVAPLPAEPPLRRRPVGGVQHRVLRGVPVGGGRDREPPPG